MMPTQNSRTQPKMQKIIIIIAIALLSGCAYQPDIVQGNIVTEAQLEKLAVGMNKRQVTFLLGTPMLKDPFHADRWDYYYGFTPGGGTTEAFLLTLYFDGDVLQRYESRGTPPKVDEDI